MPVLPSFARNILLTSLIATTAPLSAADSFSTNVAMPVRMLVPGFTVRELPVKLTSINNVEYAPDGRLFAGGYDGRFHLLRDTDGDGLEDEVDTFSPEQTPNYPLGMLVKNGEPYVVLSDEVVRFVDTNGDGIPDKRETVVKGFDDPVLAKASYLNHRRVDSAMAIAYGPDGSLYVTMGNAGYNNPYWKDKQGVAHYSTDQRRGCLLRFTPDGKVEQLASGLRYIMSLQFNKRGDLFGTDQEGATWVPNGNPFDELLHIQAGRHYGFPPRHPKWLPDVIDEPSVFDYRPQHQSTCGFRFNGPSAGRGRFGPEFWTDDALVTGESRGKAACATCHQLRGVGFRVGPELGNLVHRDYDSVLKDIVQPSATINPDAVGYVISTRDGETVTGTRLGETDTELQVAQPGGLVAKIKKSDILKSEAMSISLMPEGLDKTLTKEELRDLMTYLLIEPLTVAKKTP